MDTYRKALPVPAAAAKDGPATPVSAQYDAMVALTTYAGVTALASAVKPLAAVAMVPPAV